MPPTFRVRYTPAASARLRSADVLSVDIECELDQLPGRLPAGAYLLSIENLTERRAIHWTRWPGAIRPGTVNGATGQVVT